MYGLRINTSPAGLPKALIGATAFSPSSGLPLEQARFRESMFSTPADANSC